jgi:hypothetical protein
MKRLVELKKGLTFDSLEVKTQKLENTNQCFNLKVDSIEHLWASIY